MKLILFPILAFLASCSGFRFDMECDLELVKQQQRVKTVSVLPHAAIKGTESAIQAGEK